MGQKPSHAPSIPILELRTCLERLFIEKLNFERIVLSNQQNIELLRIQSSCDFSKARRLEFLDVSGGPAPSALSRLKKLRYFDTSGTIPGNLDGLCNLETLIMRKCRVTPMFGDLHRLRKLDVSLSEEISDERTVFSQLPLLEVLIANGTPITGSGFEYLTKLRKLEVKQCKYLNIEKNARMRALLELNARNSAMTDKTLSNMENLRVLNVSETCILGKAFKCLTKLTKVNVRSCPNLKRKYLKKLKSRGIRLKK